jgi:hypothetical protein
MLPIYTITTVPATFPHKPSRCIGWLESCADAFAEVRYNAGDMYEEGHYRYVVIEQVEQGIYTFPREEFWFEWDENRINEKSSSPGYIILEEKPNRFKQTVGWSMG